MKDSFAIGMIGVLLLASGAQAALSPGFERFDLNGNGQIDADEMTPAFQEFINRAFVGPAPEVTEEFVQQAEEIPTGEGLGVSPERERAGDFEVKFLIRGSGQQITLGQDLLDIHAASGTQVSYDSNFRSDEKKWRIKGALLAPLIWNTGRNGDKEGARLARMALVPAVDFDRLTSNDDEGDELDSLEFSLGTEMEFLGGRFFKRQYFSIAPVYTTDFSFRSTTVSGKMRYEPKNPDYGLGGWTNCYVEFVRCQMDFALVASGGRTLDSGDKENLSDDDTFFWFGPAFSFAVQPTVQPFDRLSWKTEWYYYYTALGTGGDADKITSTIAWRLDDDGHFAISTTYEHGDIPTTRDKITTLTTGLTIKF